MCEREQYGEVRRVILQMGSHFAVPAKSLGILFILAINEVAIFVQVYLRGVFYLCLSIPELLRYWSGDT